MHILNKIFKSITARGLYLLQEEKYAAYRKKYNIADSFKFNGSDIDFHGDGLIEISENSYVGARSAIQSAKNTKVKIGANCRISHNVRIYTSSSDPDQDFNNFDALTKKEGNVIIEDAVWIGANVLINPGITIGNNAVVGANSVVTKNIDPWAIVGGVPAKYIRTKKKNDGFKEANNN